MKISDQCEYVATTKSPLRVLSSPTNYHTAVLCQTPLTDNRLDEHLAQFACRRVLQCSAVHATVRSLLHQLFATDGARLDGASSKLVRRIGNTVANTAAATAAASTARIAADAAAVAAGGHCRIGAIAARR